MARCHFCNILRDGQDSRQVWQFLAASRKFPLQKEEEKLPNEALTAKLFAKDWEHLVQPRLNVAWLSPEHIFLRVVQLPKAEAEETRAMLDLQLEKLSPIPVAQVVWSYELFEQPSGEMQTAVLLIVSRQQVDLFLSQLEKMGYLPDRLELPFLDQLRAEYVQGNGIWVYADWGSNPNLCLVAWWQDGVLHNLCLIHLPDDASRINVFQEQIKQMAWAAELEGWLRTDLRFCLVTDSADASSWKSLFDLDQPVELVAPIPRSELAALTARRVAGNSQHTNLLPAEYNARYKQRYVDRLWMRGLGAALALYMIGVAVYFGWIEIAKWKLDRISTQLSALSLTYTNTLQLKEQVRIMKNQAALQFAALDSWKAAADNLPTELTLEDFAFEQGRRVTYFGLVAMDDVQKVNDFYDAMRDAKVGNQRLFKYVDPPKIRQRPPMQMAWSFFCDLERSETE